MVGASTTPPPAALSRASRFLAVLMGMAKPTPALWPTPLWAPAGLMIWVLMPMMRPVESSSGPPLLPGLMAASV